MCAHTLRNMKRYSTVIIEDQRMFRDLMRTLVNSSEHFEVIATANNAGQGWESCREHQPDVALIDIELPDHSGIDLGIRLQSLPRPPALVAVSSMVDPVTTTRVFDSGFSGYVEKNQPPDIVLDALHAAAEGGLYFTQLVRENRRRIFNDVNAINKILSQREQRIVSQICRGQKNKEIANSLKLSVRTVENHRYRIMRKLMLDSSEDLLEFGQRLGLHHIE